MLHARKKLDATGVNKQPSCSFNLPAIDAALVRRIRHSLKRIDFVAAVTACIVIVLALIEEDLFFKNDNQPDVTTRTLRGIGSLLVAASLMLLVRRYMYLLSLKKAEHKAKSFDSFYSSGLYKPFFFEVAINILHCPVGLDAVFEAEIINFKVTYSFDMVFTALNMLRSYVLIRALSYYTSSKALEAVVRWHSLTNFTIFKIKVFLVKRPVLGAMLLFVFCLFGFAVFVMLVEK
jgi:hypothetical protein